MKTIKDLDFIPDYIPSVKVIESSLDYQLGMMTSEYVIAVALPTLSTDSLQSNRVIEVSHELATKWKEMKETWFNSVDSHGGHDTKVFYSNLEWYKRNIEDKYLEDELVVRVPKISPGDLEGFAKGFEDALWNCDLSHYKYGELKQEDDISWATKIILKRDK